MNGNKLQEDEWEKWRREVDRPSAGLVFGGLLMVPLVWLWWGVGMLVLCLELV